MAKSNKPTFLSSQPHAVKKMVHKSPLEIHRTEAIPELPYCFERNNYFVWRDE